MLNMRTTSLWEREYLDTLDRTMTHHPSSLVPSRASSRIIVKKVRRWLLFTCAPAQLQGPHVASRLTGPAWDACDELEPDDVATADGVNMILDTLAEAFQGEYDVDRSHTACVSLSKEALIEQEEDIDLETALAPLELESDTDLEETDVQEIPLAYKESRQLRGEQRVSCDQVYGARCDDVSCQPNVDCEWGEWHEWNDCSATCHGLRHRSRHVALQGSGHGKFCTCVADEVQNCGSSSACEGEAKVDCQWSDWNSWPSCSVTCGGGQYNRSVFRVGEEAKTSFFVYFGRDHSMSDYIGKGVIDTGCSRLKNGNRCFHEDGA